MAQSRKCLRSYEMFEYSCLSVMLELMFGFLAYRCVDEHIKKARKALVLHAMQGIAKFFKLSPSYFREVTKRDSIIGQARN